MLLAAPGGGQVQAATVSLPGGGTSLTETHGDWTVACRIVRVAEDKAKKVCALSQQQVSGKTHQRALQIVLQPDKEGASGELVLPFGLALAKGVAYQLDNEKPDTSLPFRTCLPTGCIVDLHFDMPAVVALKKGKVLKFNATADGGRPMSFSIPLSGFAGAYKRVTALMK